MPVDKQDREGAVLIPLHTLIGRLLAVLLVLALAAAVWQLAEVAMLLFGATLLAIGLTGAAGAVSRIARIRHSFALTLVVAAGLAFFAAALWLSGPSALLLAAPLTLFLMNAVEILYVQEGLGEAPERTR